MGTTSIEWTKNADGSQGKVWNVFRGCSLKSAGCTNCYAMKMAHRFSGEGQPYEGLTEMSKRGPRWVGKAVFVPEMLDLPLRTKKPTTWFVNSMSDVFHEDITAEQIADVFGVMAVAAGRFYGPNMKDQYGPHTFQLLTKRPERAAPVMLSSGFRKLVAAAAYKHAYNRTDAGWIHQCISGMREYGNHCTLATMWPLPNVWLGVSAENQSTADERIPILLTLPAAVKWVSAEPLLGPLDLQYAAFNGADSLSKMAGVDWVVCGGESGPGARPSNISWLRGIVKQCQQAGVPVFVKQLGSRPVEPDYMETGSVSFLLKDRKGGDMREWPRDLRVRQMPRTAAREAAE